LLFFLSLVFAPKYGLLRRVNQTAPAGK